MRRDDGKLPEPDPKITYEIIRQMRELGIFTVEDMIKQLERGVISGPVKTGKE